MYGGKSASKSTSQIDTVGVMKIKNGRNVPIRSRLEDKQAISKSSPDMSPSRSSLQQLDDQDDDAILSRSSSSKNKKFHRIFETVDEGEEVLNDFACAYVADILLQGHLFVTEAYFGFYSKVFGHVTKILIPVEKVTEIKKVRTARLIPNAVKIIAEIDNVEKKYTFSSLLSRENTHKMLVKVWKKYTILQRPPSDSEKPSLSSSDSESSIADKDSQASAQSSTNQLNIDDVDSKPSDVIEDVKPINNTVFQACIDIMGTVFPVQRLSGRLKKVVMSLSGLPRTSLFLFICTVLLLFLYLSAAFLIYRLNTLHYRYGQQTPSGQDTSDENYKDIYQWNQQMHHASVGHLRESLAVQIQQLAEVRKSLQALGMIASESGYTFHEAAAAAATSGGLDPDRSGALPVSHRPTIST